MNEDPEWLEDILEIAALYQGPDGLAGKYYYQAAIRLRNLGHLERATELEVEAKRWGYDPAADGPVFENLEVDPEFKKDSGVTDYPN